MKLKMTVKMGGTSFIQWKTGKGLTKGAAIGNGKWV